MGQTKIPVMQCDWCGKTFQIMEPKDTLGYPEGIYLNRGNIITDYGMFAIKDIFACSMDCAVRTLGSIKKPK